MGLGSKLERADHFEAYVDEVTSVIGHADRAGPLRDYLRRSFGHRRPPQRGADGGGDGSWTRFGAASEPPALRR